MKVLGVDWEDAGKAGPVDADNQSKFQLLPSESLVVMGVLQHCCHWQLLVMLRFQALSEYCCSKTGSDST